MNYGKTRVRYLKDKRCTIYTSSPPQYGDSNNIYGMSGLGNNFGQTLLQTIINCGVPITVNTFGYLVTKVISIRVDPLQSITIKRKVIVDKEFVSQEGLLYNRRRMSLVFIPSMFLRIKWSKMKLVCKKLVQAFNQLEYSMENMKNM